MRILVSDPHDAREQPAAQFSGKPSGALPVRQATALLSVPSGESMLSC